MSHINVDTFALLINFFNDNWVPMHVIVGLFEVNETTMQFMAIQVQMLLDKIGLLHRVITFVKDEGTNMSTMVATMHSIINYEPLKILRVYEGTSFGHVMSKAC